MTAAARGARSSFILQDIVQESEVREIMMKCYILCKFVNVRERVRVGVCGVAICCSGETCC